MVSFYAAFSQVRLGVWLASVFSLLWGNETHKYLPPLPPGFPSLPACDGCVVLGKLRDNWNFHVHGRLDKSFSPALGPALEFGILPISFAVAL